MLVSVGAPVSVLMRACLVLSDNANYTASSTKSIGGTIKLQMAHLTTHRQTRQTAPPEWRTMFNHRERWPDECESVANRQANCSAYNLHKLSGNHARPIFCQ